MRTNRKTLIQLLEKWEYRLSIATNQSGASLSESDAEELWYILNGLKEIIDGLK